MNWLLLFTDGRLERRKKLRRKAMPQGRLVVELLLRYGRLTPGEIARRLGWSGGNTRQILLRLTQRGLIERINGRYNPRKT